MPIEFHRDGPWELPEGWVWARLRDVCKYPGRVDPAKELEKQFQYVDLSAVDNARVRGAQTVPVNQAPSRARQPVRAGDTLLSCVRVYLRNNALVEDELDGAVASTAFCVLRPSHAIDPKYLFWFVHSRKFTDVLIPLQRGNSPPAVLDNEVRDQLIAIPPIAEQRRIVARIDELFTEIADGETSLTRARDDLDTWRRALLKAAVTGELTREWRVENGIAENWMWTTIGEAGALRLGRQRSPQHHQGEHMRPYLRVANVFEDQLDLTDVKTMNFSPDEFNIYQLRPGDILLNEGQSPELLGRPAIFRGEIEGCCFQNTLLRFRTQDGLLPEFALLVFRHYMRSGRFKQEARITTNLAHLSQSRCASIEFPVPPFVEQSKIVQTVRALEEQAFEQFEHIEASAIGQLRQSTLKVAFEGRLVEQDSRDEPAERLLARLWESSEEPTRPRRARQTPRTIVPAE